MVIKTNDSLVVNTMIKSINAIFNENSFISILRPKEHVHFQGEDNKEENLEPRRSKRIREAITFGSDFFIFL